MRILTGVLSIIKFIIGMSGIWYTMVFLLIIWQVLLGENDVFTLQFSNITAAIFFVLANLCFSWSRSLDDKRHSFSIRKLNRISVMSIFAAISFLFASLSNYVLSWDKAYKMLNEANPFYGSIWILKWVMLTIATLLGYKILVGLLAEGLHLLQYEYAFISQDDCLRASNLDPVPRRLRPYSKTKLLKRCILKNGFGTESDNLFSKENVKVKVNTNFWGPSITLTINYIKDGKLKKESIQSDNLFILNLFIMRLRQIHEGNPEEIQSFDYIEPLFDSHSYHLLKYNDTNAVCSFTK